MLQRALFQQETKVERKESGGGTHQSPPRPRWTSSIHITAEGSIKTCFKQVEHWGYFPSPWSISHSLFNKGCLEQLCLLLSLAHSIFSNCAKHRIHVLLLTSPARYFFLPIRYLCYRVIPVHRDGENSGGELKIIQSNHPFLSDIHYDPLWDSHLFSQIRFAPLKHTF